MAGAVTNGPVLEAPRARSAAQTWTLAVTCAAAMAPGVLVMITSFNAFARIYQYVPILDGFVLLAFAVIFVAILVFAIRTDPRARGADLLLSPILAGIGLGSFGMGAWGLASMGLMLFPLACFLAYVGVLKTADATAHGKRWWAASSACLALALGLLPAVLIASYLSGTTLFLPELKRQVVIASFLGLLSSVTLLGMALVMRPTRAMMALRMATS